jgi:phage terminase large subunit-like protein
MTLDSATFQHVLRSAEHWASDPFPKRTLTFTGAQLAAYNDPHPFVVMEGGNQSGKSRTSVLKVVGFALEQIEGCFPGQDINIWYCTTTYDKFAEQAWSHFKDALLWPTESSAKLPTERIESINWIKKHPETPSYFVIKRPSGKQAKVYVHSYAQGRGEFQGQTIHLAVVDEECSEEIFTEIQARTLASRGAQLIIACTPIEGEEWLDRLRQAAERGGSTVRYSFPTRDNPAASMEAIDAMMEMYKDVPEELELRLLGIPRLGSALVYGDRVFTGDHIIDFASVNLTGWTLNRAIDAGFRHPACVWIAVSPDEKQVVVYRAWKGKDLTIAEAVRVINRLSKAEKYYWDIIDPAVKQRNAETGQPELCVWQANGCTAVPAPYNKVRTGIELTWKLMSERVELPAPNGKDVIIRPRFRVIRETSEQWLDERRKYRIKDMVKEPERDAIDFRPIKQNDHLMDPTRYLILAGLKHADELYCPPKEGTAERRWWDQRHRKPKNARKA